jgi:adenylate cyclase
VARSQVSANRSGAVVLQPVGFRSAMRIACSYGNTQKVWETPEPEVLFGRAEEKWPVILDLSPDHKVSRLHGRIWEEANSCWIEDLNSSRGTQLNGTEIKGRGKQRLQSGDSIFVGQTTLRVEFGETPENRRTNYLEDGTFLLPEKSHAESGVAIAKDVDATDVDPVSLHNAEGAAARRLRMICDLPFQFATHTTLESLLPAIVDQLVEVIPTGESWALVLRERDTDRLLLKAYHYVQRPYLSETLLRRAMTDRKAFVWKRSAQVEISGSTAQSGIESGMYAPLLWQGEALGAICAGTRSAEEAFPDEDVKLLVLVSQYAAMAVATYRLQERVRRETVVKANLLRQFSPKVAAQLLAHRGALRLGGRRSEVTILNSDIRGFTRLAKEMGADETVQMLNEYLGVLVPVVFAQNGTIDKFMGDAILAVFGSPGSDPKHCENAVRAAVEMQAAVTRLNEARQLRGVPCCDFGIGIHCGEVLHGFVGTADRMEFTVIGDAVNRTQRYCAAAASGDILISPEVHERLLGLVQAEETMAQTKHEGDFLAYRVVYWKEDKDTIAVLGAN